MNASQGTISVFEAWQAVDLSNLQLSLDEQATIVAQNREDCVASRKILADATKRYKRLPTVKGASENDPIKTEVPGLLKTYQSEVDKLTKRSKFSENCFLTMYRMIRQVPDPSDTISVLIEEVKQLRQAHSALSEEYRQLEEKYDDVSSQLAEKSLLLEGDAQDEDVQALVAESVEAKVQATVQVFEEKLYDAKLKAEEEVASLNSELDLALADLEKATNRIRELEHVHGNDRVDSSGSVPDPEIERLITRDAEREQVVLAVKEELAVLKAKHGASMQQLQDAKLQHEFENQEASAKCEQLGREVDELKEELKQRPSQDEYARLRVQLLTIQKSMYNVSTKDSEPHMKSADEVALRKQDTAVADEGAHSAAEPKHDEQLDTLDSWLLENNRQLKKQLLAAQTLANDQQQELAQLRASHEKLDEALKDQSDLTLRLENDIANTTTTLAYDAQGRKPAPPQRAAQASGNGGSDKATNSMLQAVCAQRDRFRSQVEEREQKIDALNKQSREVVAKMKSLEEDNTELYQRIRFLQSYKVSERSTLLSEAKDSMTTIDEDIEAGRATKPVAGRGLGRGVEHKYRKIYESKGNPIHEFQAQEAERLIPAGYERWTVKVLNMFLQRSRGRKFLFVYGVLLHLSLLFFAVVRGWLCG